MPVVLAVGLGDSLALLGSLAFKCLSAVTHSDTFWGLDSRGIMMDDFTFVSPLPTCEALYLLESGAME